MPFAMDKSKSKKKVLQYLALINWSSVVYIWLTIISTVYLTLTFNPKVLEWSVAVLFIYTL